MALESYCLKESKNDYKLLLKNVHKNIFIKNVLIRNIISTMQADHLSGAAAENIYETMKNRLLPKNFEKLLFLHSDFIIKP